jgi:hypothetical protein
MPSKALLEIQAERQRQIDAEGWTHEHDDRHETGELARAAGCYALHSSEQYPDADEVPVLWPWDEDWWKPSDPRRDLVKAGALILAEIERMDRMENNGE